MRKLTGSEWKQLSEALESAFPLWDDLQTMLMFQLGWKLPSIAAQSKNQRYVIFELIQYTEARSITGQLIQAAYADRPHDAALAHFVQQIGATVVMPRPDTLEKILSAENIVFDTAKFRQRLEALERTVCRIDINGRATGTGFLVGPDLVLTNHHVIKGVTNGASIRLLFDHKVLDDGSTLNPGTPYILADEWLVDSRPSSRVDLQPEPKSGQPEPHELDYALLRAADRPGDDQVNYGDTSGKGAPVRGWIRLPENLTYDFSTNRALFILQHPAGKPMKLTVNTVRGFNANRTRLTYLNDTEPGASGSPCFNGNWELVALHHSGDPAVIATYNEGIPLAAIVSSLLEKPELREMIAQG